MFELDELDCELEASVLVDEACDDPGAWVLQAAPRARGCEPSGQ